MTRGSCLPARPRSECRSRRSLRANYRPAGSLSWSLNCHFSSEHQHLHIHPGPTNISKACLSAITLSRYLNIAGRVGEGKLWCQVALCKTHQSNEYDQLDVGRISLAWLHASTVRLASSPLTPKCSVSGRHFTQKCISTTHLPRAQPFSQCTRRHWTSRQELPISHGRA